MFFKMNGQMKKNGVQNIMNDKMIQAENPYSINAKNSLAEINP